MIECYECPKCKKRWKEGVEDDWQTNAIWIKMCSECDNVRLNSYQDLGNKE